MNRQEILDEINQTKLHLAYLEEKLRECEYGGWKPSAYEDYWFLSTTLLPVATINKSGLDRDRLDTYNCFKTKEEAEAEAEKILVRRQLEDIARLLNKGEELNWSEYFSPKYYLSYNMARKMIELHNEGQEKHQGTVYCLDESFKDVAIQEIGEERLKKYLGGE